MAIELSRLTQKRFRASVRELRNGYANACTWAARMHHEGWTAQERATEARANFMAPRTLEMYAFVGRNIDPALWKAYPELFYTYFRIAASAPRWFDPERPEAAPRYWLQQARDLRWTTDHLLDVMRRQRDGLPESGQIPATAAQRYAVRRRAIERAERALRRLHWQTSHLNTTHAPYLGIQVTLTSTPYHPIPSTHPTADPALEF